VLAIGGGISGIVLALWTNQILERAMPSLQSTFPVQLELSALGIADPRHDECDRLRLLSDDGNQDARGTRFYAY
jgi:hypothetical protein